MSKPYEAKLFNPTINYRGSDESMVEYLSELWKEEICRDSSNITEEETIKDYGVKDYGIKDLTNFKNTLSKVSNNLVFKGNFGCYNNALEKEMSLTKKNYSFRRIEDLSWSSQEKKLIKNYNVLIKL